MEDLKNKDKSVVSILKLITDKFGVDFFELLDFWEADNFAVGLKKTEKLIYISTWEYKTRKQTDMRYYLEFEIVDSLTSETKVKSNSFKKLKKEEVVDRIIEFIN